MGNTSIDPINEAIENVMENNLDQMRENFFKSLSQRAAERLEERKLEIASSYFGISK